MDMTKFLEGERRADQYAVALGVMTDLKKSGRLQPHQVDTYKGLLKWRAGADVIVANCHANHDWVLQN